MNWEKLLNEVGLIAPERVTPAVLTQAIQLDFYKNVCRESERNSEAMDLKKQMERQYRASYEIGAIGLEAQLPKRDERLVSNITSKTYLMLRRRISEEKLIRMKCSDFAYYSKNSISEVRGIGAETMRELEEVMSRFNLEWK